MGVLMDLSAYTPAQLQVCRALLVQANTEGLSMNEFVAAIDARLPVADPGIMVVEAVGKRHVCPSCDRGEFMVMAKMEGVYILVCRSCRYSTIVE